MKNNVFSAHFRRPRFWPCATSLLAVAAMLSLGFWQLHRLEWKETLIAQLAANQAQAALEALPEDAELPEAEFRNITLKGAFLHPQTFHLVRYRGREVGYHLLTPFQPADDERIILVDRGWVPSDKKSPQARPETETPAAVTVSGMLRRLPPKKLISPANSPDKNLWIYADLAAMQDQSGLNFAPLMIEMTGKAAPGTLPIPSGGAIQMRNNHLGYALTWFAIAIAVIVIFAVYHRKPSSLS